MQLFVRDDDIGELTPPLRVFMETFAGHGIPVSYQIIPADLTEGCARYLLEMEAAHPRLIEFGQHGLRHAMDLGGKRLKREFGPERSFAQQQADIVEGLEILKARLGPDRQIDVFTPPQHKFDRNTVVAAANAGHRVFSAACYPTLHHRFAYGLGRRLGLSSLRHHGISYQGGVRPEADIREVSIAVAVDDGRTLRCPAEDLPAAIARAGRRSSKVGLMFHHKVYLGDEGAEQLREIAACLAKYSGFHKLGDLAAR